MLSIGGILEKARHPRVTFNEVRAMMKLSAETFYLGDHPYFDEEALAHYSSLVKPGCTVFEYGSGSSTLFAAQRGATVVSVESERRFAEAVRRELNARALHAEVIHCDIGPTLGWGVPFDKYPSPSNVARWKAYVDGPWMLGSLTPTIILVDGRFRVACVAKAAIEVVEARLPVCVLLDDFVDRPHYEAVLRFCTLRETAGRMAILEPKRDALECATQIYKEAVRDWR